MEIEDTLSDRLTELKYTLPKVAKDAVKESSQSAESIVKKHTPRSGESFSRKSQRNKSRVRYYNAPLAESVKSKVTYGKTPSYVIGYNKMQGWREHFLRGTVNQEPSNHYDAMYDELYQNDYDIKLKKVKEAFKK